MKKKAARVLCGAEPALSNLHGSAAKPAAAGAQEPMLGKGVDGMRWWGGDGDGRVAQVDMKGRPAIPMHGNAEGRDAAGMYR
jgi:hypothetical protein